MNRVNIRGENPMAQAEIRSRADELEVAFERRARENGRTFAQEVEELLKSNAPFSPEERVAVSRYFRSQHPEIQPSLTLDEIREGLE
jgi:antitoxin FitA